MQFFYGFLKYLIFFYLEEDGFYEKKHDRGSIIQCITNTQTIELQRVHIQKS